VHIQWVQVNLLAIVSLVEVEELFVLVGSISG